MGRSRQEARPRKGIRCNEFNEARIGARDGRKQPNDHDLNDQRFLPQWNFKASVREEVDFPIGDGFCFEAAAEDHVEERGENKRQEGHGGGAEEVQQNSERRYGLGDENGHQ